jgi:acyl transferase domain-containing protein
LEALNSPHPGGVATTAHGAVPPALESSARAWLAGESLDLDALFVGKRRRLRLPTRSFDRERFWLDPQASTGIHPAAWWLELTR